MAQVDSEQLGHGEVLDFMRLVWGLDNGLQSASKQMEQHLGVTGPQRLVLRLLGLQPRSTAGHLAQVLHLHPSTLTGVLRRLTGRRLIRRRGDPDDKRRALFELTSKGVALNDVRAGTVESAVRRTLAQVSPRQIEATRVVLAALAAQLRELVPAKPRAASARTRS